MLAGSLAKDLHSLKVPPYICSIGNRVRNPYRNERPHAHV